MAHQIGSVAVVAVVSSLSGSWNVLFVSSQTTGVRVISPSGDTTLPLTDHPLLLFTNQWSLFHLTRRAGELRFFHLFARQWS